MLVNLKEILDIAKGKGFAIPAFNVYNMETVMGVIDAAKKAKAPIIIQSYSRLFSNEEAFYLAPIVLKAAEEADIPVCFHLDHGAGEKEVTRALRYGCTGVMIDASMQSFEDNIATTKKIKEMCAAVNVPIEGELGHIGSTKDGITTEYTKVDEAVKYVNETGVCALAIMVGTAHGHYKQAPKLAIDRIKEIADATDVALVLHGGSGVGDDQIKEAIKAGITKINFGTDVCCSFLDKVFDTSRDLIAIDLFMKDAIKSVSAFATEKIKLLGAENKA